MVRESIIVGGMYKDVESEGDPQKQFVTNHIMTQSQRCYCCCCYWQHVYSLTKRRV